MEDTRSHFRRAFDVPHANGTYRLAVTAFSPPISSYVVYADPVKVLAATVPGGTKDKSFIGSRLEQYRVEKGLSNTAEQPSLIPYVCISGLEMHGEKPKLYDVELTKYLIAKGSYEVPFQVMGGKKDAEVFAKGVESTRGISLVHDLGYDYHEGSTLKKLPADGIYTQFMPISEIIECVDSHVSGLNWISEEELFDDRNEFYRKFTSTQQGLDILIYSGAKGITVKQYWDGISILEAMKAELQNQKSLIEDNNVSALEKLNRFAMLHGRYVGYTSKTEFSKTVDIGSIERIEKLAKMIAERIVGDQEALSLANTELSNDAKIFLQKSLPEGVSFKPLNDPLLGKEPNLKLP